MCFDAYYGVYIYIQLKIWIDLQLNIYKTYFLRLKMSAEEQAIQGVIDQIWDTYDVDKSGALDK